MTRHPEPRAARSSVARAVVVSLATLIAISSVFTLSPPPVGAAVPGQWEGQKGSIADGTGGTTAGTFLAAGASLAGDAQFTYDVPVSGNDGESGTWSFFTVADATETVGVDYRWTGLHAWFNVTAKMEAVVVRGGTLVSSVPLEDEGPASCCTTPSNGFDLDGSASFEVESGDVYGFVLRGSNGDFNDFLRGELTIGAAVPESCADAQDLYAPWVPGDGRYVINPAGGERFTVHCADMLSAGLDYLEIRSGPGVNFSSYAAGGAAVGTTVTTSFTKLRLDPANLTVDVGDLRFATSTGSLVHPDAGGDQTVTSMPYATAMGCEAGVANGTANLNLQGTPFAVDDTFGVDDSGHRQRDLLSARPGRGPDRRRILRLDRPRAAAVQPVQPGSRAVHPRPALPERAGRLAVVSGPLRLGRAVVVDGGPLRPRRRRRGPAGDGRGPRQRIVHRRQPRQPEPSSPRVTQQTDADGYLLFEEVAGIGNGTFVTITVTAPTGTGASACIRTTADNDAWPRALALAPAGTASVSDVIEADGKARWYRFAIVPNQRVTVTLSGLPADYDLAVFRDIGKEFATQLAPQDADGLTRLSAEFAPSVFSPSVFSPSVFSPSVFSPDAYAPSVFSPSVFSPIGVQPIGLQPVRVQSIGLQPERVQPIGVQPERVQPIGLQPVRLQPIGLQPERLQRRGARAGVLERAEPQPGRRLGGAGNGHRDRRRQLVEQHRLVLRARCRPWRRLRPGPALHPERRPRREHLRRRHRYRRSPTVSPPRVPGPSRR